MQSPKLVIGLDPRIYSVTSRHVSEPITARVGKTPSNKDTLLPKPLLPDSINYSGLCSLRSADT